VRYLNKKTVATVVASAVAGLALTACGGGGDPATIKESVSQQKSYGNVVADQPAHAVKYSPTRADKNFWIDTWGQGQKNAYVYIMHGDKVFYYVLGGPPTNQCLSLTPPDRYDTGTSPDMLRPAPRVDGVYSGGGQCMTFMGRDATTGSYIEYTQGMNDLVLVYSEPQPFPQDILVPLGDTKQ
jgi:hypothetical protein